MSKSRLHSPGGQLVFHHVLRPELGPMGATILEGYELDDGSFIVFETGMGGSSLHVITKSTKSNHTGET